MRPTLKEFKKKTLFNPVIEKEYKRLFPTYERSRQLPKIRKEAELIQDKKD
jgi:hypothetical protein